MSAFAWKIVAAFLGICPGRIPGVGNCDRERGHGGRCTRTAWPRVEWDRT
jgi:hypothetical protein